MAARMLASLDMTRLLVGESLAPIVRRKQVAVSTMSCNSCAWKGPSPSWQILPTRRSSASARATAPGKRRW
eukprot:13637440-Alexandrium_andersonii.AAC.1